VRQELDEQEQEYDEERLQQYVEEDLRQEKTLAWLREHSEVELVPEGSLQTEDEETEEAASEAVVDAESETAE